MTVSYIAYVKYDAFYRVIVEQICSNSFDHNPFAVFVVESISGCPY